MRAPWWLTMISVLMKLLNDRTGFSSHCPLQQGSATTGEPPGGRIRIRYGVPEDVLHASYPHNKGVEWTFLENLVTDFCQTKTN